MRFGLDTNTCIDAMKGVRPGLAERFAEHAPEDIVVPSMVRAELLLGALKSNRPKENSRLVERFLEPYQVIPFDREAGDHYADIRSTLESKGLVIRPNDLVIAATARSRGLTLVTRNTVEFERVAGLQIEDWST
jgi:tRNA(fMet)-specific endonuclease VapC